MTPRDQTMVHAPDVPRAVLEALVRDHLADPTATISASSSTPCAQHGTNDSTTFVHATFSWARVGGATGATTWILKHWQTAGVRDRMLGITQSREVLAWERGWLRPAALPDGVIAPIVGTWRAPDATEAWLAMTDVSAELAAYPRMSLSGDAVISRTQAILEQLARFHAHWEQPERQADLHCPWLRRPESTLWEMAPTYTHALEQPLSVPMPPDVYAPPVWDDLRADLHAFLDARPADEQRLWIDSMTDRTVLVDGLAAYPQTLLHNDLDDRNIGLRWSDSDASAAPDLVLIDWEWIGVGSAAIDVANVIQRAPVLITPGMPIPEDIWSDMFSDHYFAHYRAAGGRCADAAWWRRAVGLALVALGVRQTPAIHGSLRRALCGEIPLPQIIGVPEAVIRQNLHAGLPMMEQMEQRVLREARRWL